MKLTERRGRLAGAILAIAMAVTSCYDDSALVERVTQLEYNLEALQQTLTEQLNALNALMSESIYIKTCEANEDGSYKLTLSSGDKFTVYPDQSLESVVTYISMSGTKYWAYYDEDGAVQLIYDAAGSRIPITTVPKVVLEDGVNYLVFGTERFPLSGNSVFSAYEINKDEHGNVISATFTFGKDMSFTIPMGDGKGVRFVYQNIDQTVALTEQYVSYGETVDVQIELVGVVDYVWKEPKGWTIEEYVDDYGYTYLSITAPSKAQIEAGNAVDGGVLKVISVLEGNGAGVSRLDLTANPFNNMTVSAGVAAVDICFGLQKYAYGVCTKADFDESVIVAKATEMLASSSSATGYAMAERAVEFQVASVYGSEMTPGENYVLWALPAVYNEEEGFLFSEGTIQFKEFVHTTLKFELDEESVTFRDAALSFDLKGATEYYGGVFKKPELDETSTLFGNILPYIEGGEIAPLTTPMLYDGSAFKFAGSDLVSEPNTTYVVWLLVPELGQTKFSEADVKYIEFTTSPLSSGSSVTVDAVVTPGYVNAKASVSAEGAELIFYSFLKSTSASAYSTDELREKYLLTQGDYVKASAAEITTAADAKFDPGTKLTLFTLAVDQNGAYGPVKVHDFTLKNIEYNSDLAVTLEVKTNEPNNLVVNVSSKADGVEYIYWVGKTSESFWTGSSNLGGTEAKASKFMFLNPDNSRFTQMASRYPVTDGKIVFDDLSLKADYILVVMARKMIGSEMSCSSVKTIRFTTKAMALGTIVTEAGNPTAWNAAKPTITWLPEKFTAPAGMMNATMAFNFERPQGVNLTYYVMCATDSYFNDGKEGVEIPMDDLIISIVEQSSKAEDANVVIKNFDTWVYPEDYKFTHYPHGFSMRGHCLIYPDKAAHDALCDCGGCQTGTITVNKVENLPWEQKVYYYSDCPLEFMSDAVGTEEGIDKIFVTCRDSAGNFYEPFVIPVPYEHFANAGSRDE